jgi:hypothetical protein
MMPTLPGGSGADEHMVHPFVAQTLFPLDKFVFHQHVKATKGNLDLLRNYDMPTIVTIRNIFDIMISVKEKMDAGIYVPCVVSPVPWIKVDEQQKWNWIAYNITNWNLAFYASWKMAEMPKLFVRYEDYYPNQWDGMKRIFEFLGTPRPHSAMIDSNYAADDTLNVGISGRGAKVPQWVQCIAYDQTRGWGELGQQMRKELLECKSS